ncbi:MAG TPA: HAD-IA family hydrolase [Candidatus Brocadiia bacterium]|nr:HAD-IA family hydrolase [Candidatus Brocadiia bacterium]
MAILLNGGIAIDAVFLDAGETLIYPEPPVGTVYSSVAARYGVFIAPDEMERLFRMRWRELVEETRRCPEKYLHPPDPSGRQWWRILVDRIMSGKGPALYDRMFEELYEYYAHGSAWSMYPDVKPAIEALCSARVHLGVISNWDSRLEKLLSALGLADSFQSVTISSYEGYLKPHPAIFRAALAKAGVMAERAILVGDRPAEDVDGARAAGMIPILLDRRGEQTANCLTITSLAQLPPMLGLE